jgi:hypothetical protein
LALFVLSGFFLNIVFRTQLASLAMTLTVLCVGAGLFAGGRLRQRSSQILVAAAMALSPWFFLRAAGGLTAATLAAVVGLMVLGVGLSRSGRFQDMRGITLAQHAAAQVTEWVFGLAMVQRFLAKQSTVTRWIGVFRGVVFAAPVVLVLGLLLGSADQVFANVLLVDDAPTGLGHLVVTAVLTVGLLGFLSRAAHATPPTDLEVPRRLGSTEVTIMLGSVALLFLAFVSTQVVVALGGVDHVLETEGLTQAEHARRGFFQLMWVAALTLVLLGVLRSIRSIGEGGQPDRFRPLGMLILGLTLVITAISVQRLLFYVDAFGLTPLRFWTLASAGWIGLVILGYLASIAGFACTSSWFPAFMVVSATLFVLGLNVANPDLVVARYNINNVPVEGQLDVAELSSLSTDAFDETFPVFAARENPNVRHMVCRPWTYDHGWLGANWSQEQAEDQLALLCNR